MAERYAEAAAACRFGQIAGRPDVSFVEEARKDAAESLGNYLAAGDAVPDYEKIRSLFISNLSDLVFREKFDLKGIKFFFYKILDQLDLLYKIRSQAEGSRRDRESYEQKRLIEDSDTLVRAAQVFLRYCRKLVDENSGGSGSFLLRNIQRYIHLNYRNAISLTDLADEYSLSVSHLSKVFKEELGESYIQYLTRYRLEQACVLLEEGRFKIYEVAREVGYRDTKYFIQLFRRKYGMTPFQYKQKGTRSS